MKAVDKIDINMIPERAINVEEFKKEYEEWINSSGLLHKKSKNSTSEGLFSSNVWILYSELSQSYRHIDFDIFIKCLFRKILSNDDIILIKCWLIDELMGGYDITKLQQRSTILGKFLESTENFNKELVNGKKGNAVQTFLSNEISKSRAVTYITDYIGFLDTIGLTSEGHMATLAILQGCSYKEENDTRKLPESKDILAFSYYLNKFFDESHDENLLYFYKPVLLWWKTGMVIPMRASEFAYKLKRNCLISDNGEYFLSIDRVKVKTTSKKRGVIPLLNKIGITKEIYDLIHDYIQCTNFDYKSKTLISYRAMKKFKRDYLKSSSKKTIRLVNEHSDKVFSDEFNRANLDWLIISFYRDVIENYYNYKGIKRRLLPGDLRHLAFSSLILQGVSPIEIAMLGGQTTLRAQVSYTGHVEYYIDSEILDFIGTRNIQTSVSSKDLIKIIFGKPEVCPKLLADCYPTEDGIGYCTLDIEMDDKLCDDIECCIYCKKWWCEPTNDNFIKAKAFIEKSQLAPLQQTIRDEETFLINLLSQAKLINIGGLLELDKDDESIISQTRLKLKSNIDKLISIKKSLVEVFNINVTNDDTGGNLLWEDIQMKLTKMKSMKS